MNKIFIDGAKGTTALQIKTLLKPLQNSGEIELLDIVNTRDVSARQDAFKQADLAILCLPDDAARDTVKMVGCIGAETKIIDASSAHRTDPNWAYGFPELDRGRQADRIREAQFVSNPGCYATGAISILCPLVFAGMVDRDAVQTIIGFSGYTGGGKELVNQYEDGDDNFQISKALTSYSLCEQHKHVPEIKKYSGLRASPTFLPHVVNQPRGMIVSIPFNQESLSGSMLDAYDLFKNVYDEGGQVEVMPLAQNQNSVDFSTFTQINKNRNSTLSNVFICITGWSSSDNGQTTVHALLDNLGKGAGAQVVQNMKLMLNIS